MIERGEYDNHGHVLHGWMEKQSLTGTRGKLRGDCTSRKAHKGFCKMRRTPRGRKFRRPDDVAAATSAISRRGVGASAFAHWPARHAADAHLSPRTVCSSHGRRQRRGRCDTIQHPPWPGAHSGSTSEWGGVGPLVAAAVVLPPSPTTSRTCFSTVDADKWNAGLPAFLPTGSGVAESKDGLTWRRLSGPLAEGRSSGPRTIRARGRAPSTWALPTFSHSRAPTGPLSWR